MNKQLNQERPASWFLILENSTAPKRSFGFWSTLLVWASRKGTRSGNISNSKMRWDTAFNSIAVIQGCEGRQVRVLPCECLKWIEGTLDLICVCVKHAMIWAGYTETHSLCILGACENRIRHSQQPCSILTWYTCRVDQSSLKIFRN